MLGLLIIMLGLWPFILIMILYRIFAEDGSESDKYHATLTKRDAELAALENGRGVTISPTSEGIAVEPASRRNNSAMTDQGNANEQYNLGVMCAYGQGVTQDYQEALKWFRLSAAQGNLEAQGDLGAMYQAGFGVPQDYAQAMMWYLIAKAGGTTLADQNLQQLESLSAPAQIAQRMAKEWATTHPKKS
jgi:TPR repeat protein